MPKGYTVAQFVEERDSGKCPEGKWLKFDDIDVIGPNAAGIYTMTQDGAADAEDPKILFTMKEEAMTGGEVSSVNIVTVHVLAGCALEISSAQSQ